MSQWRVTPDACPLPMGRGRYLQARSLRSTVEVMAPNKQPTPEGRSDAIRIALAGLASGEQSEEVLSGGDVECVS